MATAENLLTCGECGATVYPEHIKARTADYLSGKLLCGFCLNEKRGGPPATNPADERLSLSMTSDAPVTPTSGGAPTTGTRIQTLGTTWKESAYKRPLLKDSSHATRCRTFHCKLADGAFIHVNEQINEWVDSHPEIEIKFATSSIGVVEGKHNDPHLILTLFY